MLAVLITLTPGRQNRFIYFEKAKVHIAVLPILDVKTCWNSTLEALKHAYQLREFIHEGLQNPNTLNTGQCSQLEMNGRL
jgi:hypothetical protein